MNNRRSVSCMLITGLALLSSCGKDDPSHGINSQQDIPVYPGSFVSRSIECTDGNKSFAAVRGGDVKRKMIVLADRVWISDENDFSKLTGKSTPDMTGAATKTFNLTKSEYVGGDNDHSESRITLSNVDGRADYLTAIGDTPIKDEDLVPLTAAMKKTTTMEWTIRSEGASSLLRISEKAPEGVCEEGPTLQITFERVRF